MTPAEQTFVAFILAKEIDDAVGRGRAIRYAANMLRRIRGLREPTSRDENEVISEIEEAFPKEVQP
jgi:hypothetical protein